jgi:hypothetical protein
MSRWSVDFGALANKTKADLSLVVRKVMFDAFSSVVRRSPVRSGRFRANWNVTYGQPSFTVTDSTQQARAIAETQKALTLPVGGVVWMANGLPYANRLEHGYSKQAPAGMVRLAIAEVQNYISQAVKK